MKILDSYDYSKAKRGSDLFECEGIEYLWPRCEIKDCTNNICVGLSLSLCYLHGIEFGAFTKAEFEESRK